MKTLFIGQNSIHLQSVDSTNSYAIELLRQMKPVEGSVIYTFEQQQGRGQRNNLWESEPNKNVALSMILYPLFLGVEKQFLFTKMISLAVADLMAALLSEKHVIKIKWPNDVYINGNKIAGILIENSVRENNIQNSVIGVGININQSEFVSTKKATSLKLLTHKEFDLKNCIEKLCGFAEARYLQLKANKVEKINEDYLKYLYQLNEWFDYKTNDQKFRGKIVGVSETGKLKMQVESGQIKEFDLKEIEFL